MTHILEDLTHGAGQPPKKGGQLGSRLHIPRSPNTYLWTPKISRNTEPHELFGRLGCNDRKSNLCQPIRGVSQKPKSFSFTIEEWNRLGMISSRDSDKSPRVKNPWNMFLGGGFKYFFMFTPIWARFPFWLIFFKGVETTNQMFVFSRVFR